MGHHRIQLTDIPYHVFSRGNNKARIFLDDFDRVIYLKILRSAHQKFDFDLFSYALMDNHWHLLLQMLGASCISRLMHWVQLGYAKHFNRKYGRVGHVFQSRYNSILVDTDRYFLTVDRYIHLQAVRAGMVSRPEDFKWTSYQSRLKGLNRDLLTHETVLEYFGRKDRKQRIQEYKAFTESAIHLPEEWSHELLCKTTYHGSLDFLRKIQSRLAIPQQIPVSAPLPTGSIVVN